LSGVGPASSPGLVLQAARVLTPFEEIRNGGVVVAGPRIVDVGPAATLAVPSGAHVVDCGDATIVPGFVDVHIHGSGGRTAMEGAEAVRAVSRFIARHGVTAWVPTLTARSTIDETAAAIRAALAGASGPVDGAEVVGLHLEGPYVNPKRPGALRLDWFRSYDPAEVAALLDAGAGRIRLMTLAPELPGGLALVRQLRESGVVASIGHTDATGDEAAAAFAAGVTCATHAFNAMRGFHHRDPGVVGALLDAPVVTAELIADGVHVHPVAMRALIRAKSPDRVALITDAVAPAGLGNGTFEFEGRPITVQAGRATLPDGTIAGSVATFDANLRRIVRDCGIPLRDAILMASTTPARAIGLEGRKGSLAGGRDADLVVLDRELNVTLTMTRGEIVFRREG
jgi:N-acetylglucosamine-6-phosphate deacetylase